MKKRISIMLIAIMALGFLLTVALYAKDQKDEGEWINITITNLETNKDKIRIKLPLSLLSVIGDWIPQEHMKTKECDVDLKKLADALKKSGNTTLIYIEDHEENQLIRIWID